MASLVEFQTGDPFRESEERRTTFLNAEEDRSREIQRERELNDAMRAGLQRLTQPRPTPAAQPAPSPVAPAGPSTQVAGPQMASAGGGAAPPASPHPVMRGPSPLQGVQPPQAGQVDPLLEELLRNPSTAQAAFQRHAQLGEQQAAAQAREDEIEGQALDALAAGDFTTFQVLAAKTGLDRQIPQAVIQDARMRQLYVRGAKLAEQFYKDDREQAGRFLQAMIQTGGNVQAAVQAAGLPVNRPDVSLQTILHGDQRVLAIVNQLEGTAQLVTGPGGQPVQADPRAGAGGANIPAQLQVVEWVRSNMTGPGGEALTAEQAWQIANAAKQNPTNAVARVWATVFQDTFDREAADQAAQEFGAFLNQFNPAASMTGQTPQGTPPPQQNQSGAVMSGRPVRRFNPDTGGFE